MTRSARISIFYTLVFSVVYPAIYALDWPLFTYYPKNEHFVFGRGAASVGATMYWYGWWVSAGIAALVFSVPLGLLFSGNVAKRVSSIIPLAAFASAALFVFFFRHLLFG